jgi:hypothetical protein
MGCDAEPSPENVLSDVILMPLAHLQPHLIIQEKTKKGRDHGARLELQA